MKNPWSLCTSSAANTITPASSRATTRVPKPNTSKTGPTDSARIPSHPATVGMPRPRKNCSVAEGPYPPNQPNSFWAPWGNITTATVSRSSRPTTSPLVWKITCDIVMPPIYLEIEIFYIEQNGEQTRPTGGSGNDESRSLQQRRGAQALGGLGPRLRRSRAPLAGQHRPHWARHDRVRGAGSAVPQGRTAGVRRATPHP